MLLLADALNMPAIYTWYRVSTFTRSNRTLKYTSPVDAVSIYKITTTTSPAKFIEQISAYTLANLIKSI